MEISNHAETNFRFKENWVLIICYYELHRMPPVLIIKFGT